MKALDLPPVWLALLVAMAWLQGRFLPLGPSLAHDGLRSVGAVLICAGLALIAWAGLVFWRARTTIIPHHMPRALITTGPFAFSRNPIYLADALILTGFVLRFDAALCLILVPVFVWLIQTRFILPEEARLRTLFGLAFNAYEQKVRRWI